MNRRSFFASLLAPFVARFAPKLKPKPAAEAVWSIGADGVYRFEWKGFKVVADPPRPGEVILGSNIIVPNPRSCFRVSTPSGGF